MGYFSSNTKAPVCTGKIQVVSRYTIILLSGIIYTGYTYTDHKEEAIEIKQRRIGSISIGIFSLEAC